MTDRQRELHEHFSKPETQRELDEIETRDAMTLLDQVSKASNMNDQIRITKGWLKKHWTKGWRAAGGPSGAPDPEPKRARKASR